MKAIVPLLRGLLLGLSAVAAAATASASPPAFPAPARPVADIVSPSWGDQAERDAADEVGQIAARLGLRPGMTVADIGAGSGYDTLRLAKVVAPGGSVIGEDVTPAYLATLKDSAHARHLAGVRTVLGSTGDPRLAPGSIDAAIMVHMYHEIQRPYDLLYNLAPAFRPGGRLGIEELDRPTAQHGTPPALLTCELQAVGYRLLSRAQLRGGLGYFAVFQPPAASARTPPDRIRPCPA